MAVKVAYDITLLANNYYRYDRKTGIYRVVEELLHALHKRGDVDLGVVGICTENPVFTALLASQYVRNNADALTDSVYECYASRFGLKKYIKKYYSSLFMGMLHEIPSKSICSFVFWGMTRIMSYAQKVDIYQSLRGNRFDIFHSPFLKLPSVQLTRNISRVLTIHDLIPVKTPAYVDFRFRSFFKRILRSIDRNRDWIVCNSEYTKQEFCNYMGMAPDRVFVTPLAAADYFYPVYDDDRIANCRERYGIPEGEYFLGLSYFQPRKNIARLLYSFFKFLSDKKRSDTYLVLVGSPGWKFKEISDLINRFQEFRRHIILTGYIPDEDLAAIYNGAKAFIFPSLYEGFGLPPLEAMQCGVPVIVSNTTSLPEVVGEAGIMVDPTDTDALCQAMIKITSDEDLCRSLRLAGLEQAKKFSWAKCAEDTVRVYKKAAHT